MKNALSQWLVSLALVAFALGCLVLTLVLMQSPPQPIVEEDEDLDVPGVSEPETIKKLPDFAAISHIPDRKQAFYELLMPMVEWRNYQLSSIRTEIEEMLARLDDDQPLSAAQRRRLERMRVHFRVSEDNFPSTERALEALHSRADIIPPAMVVAQGAAESGWGTSRFAVEGNNIFGQWCYRKGCGLVPGARTDGMTHEVQIFDSVNDAVATYFRNINTNRAYRELRQKRDQLRARNQPITGTALVEGLHRYSSRGQAYIEELKELIRFNDLENIEHTWRPQEEEPEAGEAEEPEAAVSQ